MTIKDKAPLSTGEKHAQRLGIEPHVSASRRTADLLAEQPGEGDPSWEAVVRFTAEAAAAKRAESFARLVEREAARTKPKVDPQAAEKPVGTTRGRLAAEWTAGQVSERDAEYAALVADNTRHLEARAAQGAGKGPVRQPTAWERAQIRARQAQLAQDAA